MFDACQVHYQGKPHFAGILLCGQHPDLLLQGQSGQFGYDMIHDEANS